MGVVNAVAVAVKPSVVRATDLRLAVGLLGTALDS